MSMTFSGLDLEELSQEADQSQDDKIDIPCKQDAVASDQNRVVLYLLDMLTCILLLMMQ